MEKGEMVIRFLISLIFATAMLAGDLHKEVLHTQIRVRTDKAGGSGTVIYAEKNGNFYSTYAITCHHVIEDAVKLETKWDPFLQKDRKAEMRTPVLVEFFDYAAVPHGKPPLTSGANAEIVAYSQRHDMALLQLQLSRQPAIAKLLPIDKIDDIKVGAPVVAVGCALLHDPILTAGIVTHQGDVIDYADYWMSNANIIYGNSGGGMFAERPDGYFFLGIPSRVAVIGWGSPITHLGYFSPIGRVYEFLKEQLYDFLVPGSTRTEADCAAERKKRRELEEKKVLLQ